ncbi:hypothetical protein BaRGS_00023527 [Batillaria attramentaria]|uniref:Peptidase S1 domain-containing protein n=1 Tax=Batillaria attramentaria TaxID=370345 RepID=A0ABD0KDP6_9CAEN
MRAGLAVSSLVAVIVVFIAVDAGPDCKSVSTSPTLPSFPPANQDPPVELTKRVIKGTLMQPGEAKFSASLWYKKPNPFTVNTGLDHVCGGTLIADRWVLTSAHCFDDNTFAGLSSLSDWEVVMGEYMQNVSGETGEQKFTIDAIYIHPQYNISTFDVALLFLNAPAQMSDYVGTLDIDKDPDCAATGSTCTVYGWGQDEEEPFGYGTVLPYKADVTIWDQDACAQAFEGISYVTVTGNEVCAAGTDGTDACFGDSGGPLVCSCTKGPVVSGIVFTGVGCGRAEYPGVYERVSVFTGFITSTMAKHNGQQNASQ